MWDVGGRWWVERAEVTGSTCTCCVVHIPVIEELRRGLVGCPSLPSRPLRRREARDEQQQVLYDALCDAAQETYEWQALNTCILSWPLDCADRYSAVAGPKHSTVVESTLTTTLATAGALSQLAVRRRAALPALRVAPPVHPADQRAAHAAARPRLGAWPG